MLNQTTPPAVPLSPSTPQIISGDTASSGPAVPRIWLLLSDKLGDNAQINTVAAALDLPCIPKHLRFRRHLAGLRPAFKPSLRHVDTGRSDPLVAPWPDLVIVSGRRPGAVALWIKRASGNRTKIAIIGRPHRHLDAFDLVIAPPQFALPARPNILPLTAPLFAVDAGAVAAAAHRWALPFADLPRPLTAILLGGPQPPFRFDSAVACDIVRRAAEMADGGALLILTSRRTPPSVVAALRQFLPDAARSDQASTDQAIPVPVRLFPWSTSRKANPYRAVLGLADRFVVSGDSISMIGEVLSLGKPLAIATAPLSRAPHIRLEQACARRFRAAPMDGGGIWSQLKRFCHGRGILPFARDFAGFHDNLFRRGLAVPLGMPFRQPPVPEPTLPEATLSETTLSETSDITAVSGRIRALLGIAATSRR